MYEVQNQPNAVICTAASEYPAIKVNRMDRRWSQLLLWDINAPQGKLSAAYSYQYSYWCLKGIYQSGAAIFQKIAEVELRHVDILAELCVMLGQSPRFEYEQSGAIYPWNGRMVYYAQGFADALKSAMLAEENSAAALRRQSEVIEDQSVSKMLLRLAEDDEVHYNLMREMLIQYNRENDLI